MGKKRAFEVKAAAQSGVAVTLLQATLRELEQIPSKDELEQYRRRFQELHDQVFVAVSQREPIQPYLELGLDISRACYLDTLLVGDVIDSFKHFDMFEHNAVKYLLEYMNWGNGFSTRSVTCGHIKL